MPNITTSSFVDTFMQAASKALMRSALALGNYTSGAIELGTPITSPADPGLSPTFIKINNAGGSHVCISSVTAMAEINEIYFENQDGMGARLGGCNFGLDADGTCFLGSLGNIRFINSGTSYPHPNLMTLDVTTGVLKIISGKINLAGIPTSASGLVSGDVWSNLGILTIVA